MNGKGSFWNNTRNVEDTRTGGKPNANFLNNYRGQFGIGFGLAGLFQSSNLEGWVQVLF
mgnify:CR=1 FL=1